MCDQRTLFGAPIVLDLENMLILKWKLSTQIFVEFNEDRGNLQDVSVYSCSNFGVIFWEKGIKIILRRYCVNCIFTYHNAKQSGESSFHRLVSFCSQGGGCTPPAAAWMHPLLHPLDAPPAAAWMHSPGCTHTLQQKTVNRRSVRILLECILVKSLFTFIEHNWLRF